MRTTRLSISVARTFTTANKYEPLKVEASAEIELDEGDGEMAARQTALAEVRESLRMAYLAFHPAHQGKTPAPPATEEPTNG